MFALGDFKNSILNHRWWIFLDFFIQFQKDKLQSWASKCKDVRNNSSAFINQTYQEKKKYFDKIK